MRRLRFATLSLILPIALAGTADAASVHLKGGAHAEPTFHDEGVALGVSGALAGLGNENLLVTVRASGRVSAVCVNPSGKNEPPGQNPAPVTLTGAQSIPAEEIENGNVDFGLVTATPVDPIPGAPDCPNRRWTEDIVDVAFTGATLTVEQPAGTVVLTVACDLGATQDGPVPAGQVTCG